MPVCMCEASLWQHHCLPFVCLPQMLEGEYDTQGCSSIATTDGASFVAKSGSVAKEGHFLGSLTLIGNEPGRKDLHDQFHVLSQDETRWLLQERWNHVVVFFITADLVASQGPNAPAGLFQRLSIITGWGWIVLLALRLMSKKSPLG